MLVGTISIEKSELLSRMLTKIGVRHEVLNAKNHAREALIIAEAGAKGSVTIATNMAGRGTDIKLGSNPEFRARRQAGSNASEEEIRVILDREQEKWQKDYEEVKGLGGLHVLGTERHEARRIDNQLRGRSGRQGDSGSSRFYISLDDELMRFFGENMKNIMSRVGMQDGEPLYHPWINKSIERAQKKVEERNFEIRKHLLEYDDVLNEQRKFIYSRRDEILEDMDLKKRVLATAAEIVTDLIEEYRNKKEESQLAFNQLLSGLKEEIFYTPVQDLQTLNPSELMEKIINDLAEELEQKENEIGREKLNLFIRIEYLRNIDSRWQDHLENLEALREAVYLRAYGQKNPLLEYKLDGFQIFDQMLHEIRTVIAKKIFIVKILAASESPRKKEKISSSHHQFFGQFSAAEGKAQAPVQAERVQIKRSQPKVGRNDPCPCGSGKKYKHCCGR